MARAALDTNESGSYTEDGGTSNNAKVNTNFIEAFQDVAIIDFVANTTTKTKIAPKTAATISGISAKRHTAVASAAGTVLLYVLDGDGNTLFSTASIDAEALTASFVAKTLTATAADLDIAAGEPLEVKVVSNNADATGGPIVVLITYAAG